MKGADVRVLGLVNPSHLVEDIRVGVAFGSTVIIPAEKAAVSKDLYRSISQKCLFRLPSAGPPPATYAGGPKKPAAPVVTAADTTEIQRRLQLLETRNKDLENESKKLRAQLKNDQTQTQGTLEAILEAVKSAPQQVIVQANGAVAAAVAKGEVASGEAPTYIPEVIKPEDSEARIESQQESAASDVTDVAKRLKKLRQGNQ